MSGLKQPFIIDVEASGLGPGSYPIEVGVALRPEERHSYLIAPVDSWEHWDDEAEQLHKISRASLHAHGRPVAEVAAALNQHLGGLVLFSDGWVVDKPWLTQLFHQARVSMAFHISPLELILTERQMTLWHDEKPKVIRAFAVQRHRASTDAWVVQETYIRTRAASELLPASAGK